MLRKCLAINLLTLLCVALCSQCLEAWWFCSWTCLLIVLFLYLYFLVLCFKMKNDSMFLQHTPKNVVLSGVRRGFVSNEAKHTHKTMTRRVTRKYGIKKKNKQKSSANMLLLLLLLFDELSTNLSLSLLILLVSLQNKLFSGNFPHSLTTRHLETQSFSFFLFCIFISLWLIISCVLDDYKILNVENYKERERERERERESEWVSEWVEI